MELDADAAQRRPARQVLVQLLTVVLFVAGAGLFAWPFVTDLYAERVVQQRLEAELVSLEHETPDADAWVAEAATATPGAALTRIVIPALEVSTVVVEGTSPAALRAGAGHYPGTALPGQPGNVAIAGHRTTYGRPFNRLDELRTGDEIWLSTPVGDHRYRVVTPAGFDDCRPTGDGRGACITHPRDWQVIAPTETASLTLTTCHPKGSARQRLIVRAELVESQPAGTLRASATDDA